MQRQQQVSPPNIPVTTEAEVVSNNHQEVRERIESTKERLYIFTKDDLQRVQQLKKKIIISPLKFLLTTTSIAYLAKRFNLRKIIANPLKDEADIVKNDKYWRFATYNTIVMGTLGFAAMSFYRSEANKILLYKKYEKHVSMFMKWRTQRQVKEYLRKPVHN